MGPYPTLPTFGFEVDDVENKGRKKKNKVQMIVSKNQKNVTKNEVFNDGKKSKSPINEERCCHFKKSFSRVVKGPQTKEQMMLEREKTLKNAHKEFSGIFCQIEDRFHAKLLEEKKHWLARNLRNIGIVKFGKRLNEEKEYELWKKLINLGQPFLKKADGIVEKLAKDRVLCNSRILNDYIIVMRCAPCIKTPEEIEEICLKLGIFRPNFKLVASLITTYCVFYSIFRAVEFVNYAMKTWEMVVFTYKYKPNTFLFNTMLLMLTRHGESTKFWYFVLGASELKIRFDGFTYGTMLEQCKKEKNYQKMEYVFNEFMRNEEKFAEKKSFLYVMSLGRKIQRLKVEQKRELQKRDEEYAKENGIVGKDDPTGWGREIKRLNRVKYFL